VGVEYGTDQRLLEPGSKSPNESSDDERVELDVMGVGVREL
jgi:hypothetical protein